MKVHWDICWYMQVWGSLRVQIGTYSYICVHTLFTCFVPCCTRLARMKVAGWQLPNDTLVHTQTLHYSSLFSLFALPSPLAIGTREAVAAVGRSAAQPKSAGAGFSAQRCYTDLVVPTVSTGIQGKRCPRGRTTLKMMQPTLHHTLSRKIKHGFSNQQTFNLTPWK